MGKVRLTRSEVMHNQLPSCCMVCGSSCTERVNHRFAWHPGNPKSLLSALWAMANTKRITIAVPLCSKHLRHFSWRLLLPLGCVAALFLSGLLITVVASLTRTNLKLDHPIWGLVCVGTIIALGAVVGLTGVKGIQPEEITDDYICLINVSNRFVSALEDARSKKRHPSHPAPKTRRLVEDPPDPDNPFRGLH